MSELQRIDASDRVRRNTTKSTRQEIDSVIRDNINTYKSRNKDHLNMRIRELEQEWSIERKIETFASTLILSGSLLALLHNKKWAILPAVVSGFLLQHGIQGWCPPVPLFRALGTRTRKEIDCEKFSLKIVRGDFGVVQNTGTDALFESVRKI